MAKLFPKERLPHLHSTRDTRDRLDLVTENVAVGAVALRADRILYHAGDSAAKHYHLGAHHLFYVLKGSALLHTDVDTHRLSAGMAAAIAPGEVHWFENDTEDEFAFVELWAPPPEETIWIQEDDI